MRLIERVMAVRGITQTELANASGVNRVSVNRILRGKEQAGKKRKEAMALALGYSADYADELFRVEELRKP